VVGVPLFCVSVAAVIPNVLACNVFVPFGYVQESTVQHPYQTWPEFLIYWWITALDILIVIGCLGTVLYGSLRNQLRGNKWRWNSNIRMILFLLVFLFLESWKWGYRIYLYAIQKRVVDDMSDTFTCAVVNQSCSFGERVDPATNIVFILFFYAGFVVIAVLFAANPEVSKHWGSAFRAGSNPFSASSATAAEIGDA